MTETYWHTEAGGDVLRRLDSTASGLSDDESARRLAVVGPNRVSRTRPLSTIRILARQLASIVVFLFIRSLRVTLIAALAIPT